MQKTKSLFFTWDDGTTCRLCRIGLYSIGPQWKSYIPVKRHFGTGASLRCHDANLNTKHKKTAHWKTGYKLNDWRSTLVVTPIQLRAKSTDLFSLQRSMNLMKNKRKIKNVILAGERHARRGRSWSPITCFRSVSAPTAPPNYTPGDKLTGYSDRYFRWVLSK